MKPINLDALDALYQQATGGEWQCDKRVGCVAVYPGERANCIDEVIGDCIFYRRGWRRANGGWAVNKQDVDTAAFITTIHNQWPQIREELRGLREVAKDALLSDMFSCTRNGEDKFCCDCFKRDICTSPMAKQYRRLRALLEGE